VAPGYQSLPGWSPRIRRYRFVGRPGAKISTDDIEPPEPDDSLIELPTRTRAWTQIIVISLGIIVVGTALLVVLWLLLTLTFSLISEML